MKNNVIDPGGGGYNNSVIDLVQPGGRYLVDPGNGGHHIDPGSGGGGYRS